MNKIYSFVVVLFLNIAMVFMNEIINYHLNFGDDDFIKSIIFIAWLYNAGMETSKRQPHIGTYLFGLKVTDVNGARCTFSRTTVRFIGKLIGFGLGYLLIAFTERKQALHDKLANTLVIEGEIKVKFMKKLLK